MPISRIYYIADVAAAAGWTVQRTRRTLVSLGFAHKRGGRWVVNAASLASYYPELLDLLSQRASNDYSAKQSI